MVQELDDRRYHPALSVRLRQAVFLSFLGHLRNLATLRMTIHSSAHETLSCPAYGIHSHSGHLSTCPR
ncbi:hypothetical protein N657DRAFT_649889 [Parathielavia appendiculata]|uniref:Uncharacterized protein n=1 Tax=Parathielavia appendiculata TaxID=2587402 RepID=A0AAN6TS63_9PEZI|nr:hypothetical protein N657DRAFT_649889 [Parathielavia appendiculata]